MAISGDSKKDPGEKSDSATKRWLLERLPKVRLKPLLAEQRREIMNELFYEGPEFFPYIRRFFFLLALSAIIATIGLGKGSTGVVIGAMLLAPLMTPMLAGAAAIALGWPVRQMRMALVIIIATAFALGVSIAVPIVMQLPRELPVSDEILSRARPALGDLWVALCAGAAGAYVLVRREALSVLPGVAIAVALLPPICSAGLLVHVGEYALAVQALLLYLTNLAAIVLSASVVFIALGFTPRVWQKGLTRRVLISWALAFVFVVAVAIPLLHHTVEIFADIRGRHQALIAVEQWIGDSNVDVIDVRVTGDQAQVEVVINLPAELLGTDFILRDTIPPSLTREGLVKRLTEQLERKVDVSLRAQLRFES